MSTLEAELVDPRGEVVTTETRLAARLENLQGRSVGFIDNGKINTRPYFHELTKIMQRDFGVRAAVLVTKESASLPASDNLINQLLQQVDLVVAGIGD